MIFFVRSTTKKLLLVIFTFFFLYCLGFSTVNAFDIRLTDFTNIKNPDLIQNSISLQDAYVDGDHTYIVEDGVLTKYYGPGISVKVPEGVKVISTYAFSGIPINSIIFPESLLRINNSAFNFKTIDELELPSNLETIGDKAFAYNKIKKLVIPPSVKVIGDNAFDNGMTTPFYRLESLTLNEGLEEIGVAAFNSANIKSLHIPSTVKTIGASAFRNTSIEDLSLSEGLLNIGSSAFSEASIKKIIIPSSVTDISYNAFGKNNITDIEFKGDLPRVGTDWITMQNNTYAKVNVILLESNKGWDLSPFEIANGSNVQIIKIIDYIPVIHTDELSFPVSNANIQNVLSSIEVKDDKDTIDNIEVISNTIEFDSCGRYEIIVEVSDSKNQIMRKQIIVNIVNELSSPRIIGNDVIFKAELFTIEDILNSVYALDHNGVRLDVRIKDTDVIFDKVGDYFVEFSTIDSYGKSYSEIFNITVIINNKPVIYSQNLIFKERLNSEDELLDDVYAYDEDDGVLEVEVLSHNIQFWTQGKYSVYYRVIDSDGNVIIKENLVTVLSNSLPFLSYSTYTPYIGQGSLSEFNTFIVFYDEEDGILQHEIVYHNINFNQIGNYYAIVSATDSDGNRFESTVELNVIKNPGERPSCSWGEFYSQKGIGLESDIKYTVNCMDKEDGKLEFVMTSHNINFNKVGTYHVFGYCEDSDQNIVYIDFAAYITDNYIYEGWDLVKNRWMYYRNGKPVDGWQSIDGYQYYFEDRRMISDWWLDKNTGAWYFFNGGAMQRTNLEINGRVNAFDTHGVWKGIVYEDGWELQSNNKWKYYKNNKAVNGWQSIEGLQYYFENTEMVSDWWLDKNTGAWYFFNGGVMQRKNLVINGKVNIFDTYGVWKGVAE